MSLVTLKVNSNNMDHIRMQIYNFSSFPIDSFNLNRKKSIFIALNIAVKKCSSLGTPIIPMITLMQLP